MTQHTEGQIIVHAVRIIGTPTIVFSAYRYRHNYGDHSTIQSFNGRFYGRVGTQRIPAEIEAMAPGSDERIAAVRAWHEAEYAIAYDAIVAQFPSAGEGRRSMGEISVQVPA